MAFYSPTVNRFKAAWQAFRHIPEVLPPSFVGGQSERATFSDGVDYSLPIALPEYKRAALEKAGKLEEWLKEASVAQTFNFQFDNPYRSTADLPINPVSEDPLRELNAMTRQMVLSSCHSAFERNPIARTGILYTVDYVIGEGFNLTTKNKEVDALLTDFIANPDNAIREYERQAVTDLQLDGELFIRYFKGESATRGQIVAVPLRPWECIGIQTELGFFRRPLKYHFQFQLTSGDDVSNQFQTENVYIEADEIQHVAINRHAYELRGRPELYPILPWLRAHSEFLQNRARQNHWRNALLWFVQVANASASQIASVMARWSQPPQPGSVVVESSNVNVQPLTNSTGAGEASEDGRQIKLQSIVGLRLPEYMFADGQNANLASATAQQLPAMTKFSSFQTIMIEQVWYPMFKRVLETAIDANLLPEEVQEQDSEGEYIYLEAGDIDDEGNKVTARTPKMIKTIDAFDVSYAPLQEQGKLNLAQAMSLIKANGWIDDMSAQEELGLDPAIIGKRLARQHANEQAAVAQGGGATVPDEQIVNKSPDMKYAPKAADNMSSDAGMKDNGDMKDMMKANPAA